MRAYREQRHFRPRARRPPTANHVHAKDLCAGVPHVNRTYAEMRMSPARASAVSQAARQPPVRKGV